MERWGWVCSGGIGGAGGGGRGDSLPARYEKRSREEGSGLAVGHSVDALRPRSVPLYQLTNTLYVHWRICLLEQMMVLFLLQIVIHLVIIMIDNQEHRPHFTDERTETKKVEVICQGAHEMATGR